MQTTTKTKLFPKQDLELVLRDELMLAAEAEASMHGIVLPASSGVAAVGRSGRHLSRSAALVY